MLKIVPADMSPLTVIAELGKLTQNARIYLGKKAIEKLRLEADEISFRRGWAIEKDGGFSCEFEKLDWDETSDFSKTTIEFRPICDDWFKVFCIKSKSIAFSFEPRIPKHVITIEMAE